MIFPMSARYVAYVAVVDVLFHGHMLGRALLTTALHAVVNSAGFVGAGCSLGVHSAAWPTPFCGLPGAAARIATDAAKATIALLT